MCEVATGRARQSGPESELWLSRAAWETWPVRQANVLVPKSEEQLRHKVLAIFKHQSQKDKALFSGAGERELRGAG